MADIIFEIKSRTGKKAHGTLTWPTKGLSSPTVSGDSNSDAIPSGTWTALRAKMLDKLGAGDAPYCDPSSEAGKRGHCWMQPLEDQSSRTEMGIHPDGGTPDATNGCIGLQANDTKAWYDAFYAVPTQTTIEVKNA